MRSIADPFLRRPVLTLVISLLILLGGLISLPELQVENLPPIAPGRVTVRASYPGAGPEVVEQGVTALLEKQLNGLERLDTIRSTSSANGSSITLGFRGGNPELNQINTQNEAVVVNRQLPAPVVLEVPILAAKAAASRVLAPAFISQVGRPPVMASFSWAARTSPSVMPA